MKSARTELIVVLALLPIFLVILGPFFWLLI